MTNALEPAESARDHQEASRAAEPIAGMDLFRVAWLILPAFAAIAFLAIRSLAPLLAPGPAEVRFFADPAFWALPELPRPEPVEQTGYVLAVLTPVLFAGLVVGALRVRRIRAAVTASAWSWRAVFVIQAAALLLAVWCWVGQREIKPYFSVPEQVLAALLAAAVAGALVRPDWRARLLGRLPRLPGRSGAGLAVALMAAAVVASLSLTLFRDANVAATLPSNSFHMTFTTEEFTAVATGRTPLVDFLPQYTNVLPYFTAPVLAAVDARLGVFTALMALLSAGALAAAAAGLRLLTRSWGWTAALFCSFLSLSMLPAERSGAHVHTFANYYAAMPIRYLGPLLCFALLAFWLRRRGRRALYVLGFVAGLTLCNNLDLGLPAFVAVLGAVVVTALSSGHATLREISRPVAAFALGSAAAVVAFVLLTLLHSGELPRIETYTATSRLFAQAGFGMLPIEQYRGLAILVFLTFATCVAAGVTRAGLRGGAPDPDAAVRSGLLVFTGVLGLGALAYYVGRSHPNVLINVFCAWGLALCVLAWDVGQNLVRAAAPAARRILVIPALLVFAHLALGTVTLANTRGIPDQPARIMRGGEPRIFEQPAMRRLIDACSTRGENVFVVHPLGYRSSLVTDVDNWFPYDHPSTVVSHEQLEEVVDALERRRVSALYTGRMAPEYAEAFTRAGFRPVHVEPDPGPQTHPGVSGGPELRVWRRGPARGCEAPAADGG